MYSLTLNNESSYPPLHVMKMPENALEKVREDQKLPAIVWHFPQSANEVGGIIEEIRQAIESGENCNLIIPGTSDIIPDGLPIKAAIPFDEDGIEIDVYIPGILYLDLYVNNLISYFSSTEGHST